VLVIGKGRVGKTTITAAIAVGLARRGHEVHPSTTDAERRAGGQLDMTREPRGEMIASRQGVDLDRPALLPLSCYAGAGVMSAKSTRARIPAEARRRT
jgi:Mrp family chromosome partitioning ATPase